MSIQWMIPKPQWSAESYINVKLIEVQTKEGADQFIESFFKGNLKDRVIKEGFLTEQSKIDDVFFVSRSSGARAKEIISQWVSRKIQYQGMMAAELMGVAGMSFVSLYSNRWYLIIASFVACVSLLCFAGIAYAIYSEAEHEFQVWTKPEDDFLKRRDQALRSSLPDIFRNGCRYGLNPTKGTLTDLEVLVLWKRHFKSFADELLKWEPQDEPGKLAWSSRFISNNPLSSDFFKNDPKVLNAQGWQEVQQNQKKIDDLRLPSEYTEARQILQNAKDVLIDGKTIQTVVLPTSGNHGNGSTHQSPQVTPSSAVATTVLAAINNTASCLAPQLGPVTVSSPKDVTVSPDVVNNTDDSATAESGVPLDLNEEDSQEYFSGDDEASAAESGVPLDLNEEDSREYFSEEADEVSS